MSEIIVVWISPLNYWITNAELKKEIVSDRLKIEMLYKMLNICLNRGSWHLLFYYKRIKHLQ